MFYFERFSLLSVLVGLANTKNSISLLKGGRVKFLYVDATWFAAKVIAPLLRICGVEVGILDFKMLDVRDECDELVRVRIPRSDLFKIQKGITESKAFKSLFHDSWRQDRIEGVVIKGLVDPSIHEKGSVGRMLFIIEVVAWHMRCHNYEKSTLIMRNRPWFDVCQEYAVSRKIDLLMLKYIPENIFKRSFLYRVIVKCPRLYGMLKNMKYRQTRIDRGGDINSIYKVYVEGRGDVNLENNGDHSDFFWQLNSEFPKKNILYQHHSIAEKEYLEGNGILSVGEVSGVNRKYLRSYQKPRLHRNSTFSTEAREIEFLLSSYDLMRSNWSSFFLAHQAKVYFTWNKYYYHHMVLADAIKENGGISAVWQMAFDGFESIECRVNADIMFNFSKFNHEIEKRLGSSIPYSVITGYPKDYVGPLKRKQASELRAKMQAMGAEKIVFVIDENSLGDERWHTGHELQRENYSFILEQVLSTPWLGVVFKPKLASTLRGRLGGVAELLASAEKTGRCYIYEDSGRYTTSAPPVLAGLSADICIHGHLSAGTAALECVLEGLPTLLIDREGCPNSKLYELPEGKVVFKSWPETIEAVMEHFKAPQGIPGFGDWSPIIDELDPFRDGKAAYRIGTYLHWLIQGFEKGMEREEIMADAAERYKKQWGADKVLSI